MTEPGQHGEGGVLQQALLAIRPNAAEIEQWNEDAWLRPRLLKQRSEVGVLQIEQQ